VQMNCTKIAADALNLQGGAVEDLIFAILLSLFGPSLFQRSPFLSIGCVCEVSSSENALLGGTTEKIA
jgi:hypothetical protein